MRRPMLVVGGAGFVGHHLRAAAPSSRRSRRGRHRQPVARTRSSASGRHLGDGASDSSAATCTDAVLAARGRRRSRGRPSCSTWRRSTSSRTATRTRARRLLANVVGTQLVLDALALVPDARLVFASTADVYAPSPSPHREDDRSRRRASTARRSAVVRGASSSRAPRAVRGAASLAARLFNVFGPGETNPHVLPDILAQLRDGRRSCARQPRAAPRLRARARRRRRARPSRGIRRRRDRRSTSAPASAPSVRELVGALATCSDSRSAIGQDPARVRPVERMHLVADATRCAAGARLDAAAAAPRRGLQRPRRARARRRRLRSAMGASLPSSSRTCRGRSRRAATSGLAIAEPAGAPPARRPAVLYFGAGEDAHCSRPTRRSRARWRRRSRSAARGPRIPTAGRSVRSRGKLSYLVGTGDTHPFAYQYDAIEASAAIVAEAAPHERRRRRRAAALVPRVRRAEGGGLRVIANCPDSNTRLAREMVRSVDGTARAARPGLQPRAGAPPRAPPPRLGGRDLAFRPRTSATRSRRACAPARASSWSRISSTSPRRPDQSGQDAR